MCWTPPAPPEADRRFWTVWESQTSPSSAGSSCRPLSPEQGISILPPQSCQGHGQLNGGYVYITWDLTLLQMAQIKERSEGWSETVPVPRGSGRGRDFGRHGFSGHWVFPGVFRWDCLKHNSMSDTLGTYSHVLQICFVHVFQIEKII